MWKIVQIVLYFMILVSCNEKQKTIHDYEACQVKFPKYNFTAKNKEFTILLPKQWYVNEDDVHSDTVSYILETGSKDSSLVVLNIMKLKTTYGNINTEFASIIKKTKGNYKNVTIFEKTFFKIGKRKYETAHLIYTLEKYVSHEEIYIFIPINKNQYYLLGMVCDKDEEIEKNMGRLLTCIKSFKFLQLQALQNRFNFPQR